MVDIIRAREGNVTLVGIKILPEEPFVIPYEEQQLTVVPQPRKARHQGNVTWRSTNTSAITVNSSGVITGKYKGSSAEDTAYIYANSDAGFETRVLARLGVDITAISFPSATLTIDGIQGVTFAITSTPSVSTDASIGFESTNEEIAEYIYRPSSEGSNATRMWGNGVGEATVTVYGRSGNASYQTAVTVNPVTLTSLEIRGNDNTTTTEQGDQVPPILSKRIMFVDQADQTIDLFFLPFNATERNITISVANDDIADVYIVTPQPNFKNYQYGTNRKLRLGIRSKSVGTTLVTIRGAHNISTSFTVDVRARRSFGVAIEISRLDSVTATVAISSSSSNVSLTEFMGWDFVPSSITNCSGYAWTQNPNLSATKNYVKGVATSSSYLEGAIWYYDKDGNRVKMSSDASLSW